MKLNQMHLSIRIGLVAAIIFVQVGLSVWPAIAVASTKGLSSENFGATQGCDWSGWWETSLGYMQLQQYGGIVTRAYEGWAGTERIQGNASGNKLICRSPVEINMSDDCKSFSGNLGTRNWTGTRLLKRVVSEQLITNEENGEFGLPSPDYRRIAYGNSTPEGSTVVIAGPEGKTEGKPYKDGIWDNSERFSPDSKRFAYLAHVGNKHVAAVVDGVEGKAYDDIPYWGLTFSPDSQHIAYRAKSCDNGTCKWVMVLDGVEQPYYGDVRGEPVFSSPESGTGKTHLAYEIDGAHVVLDGKMQEPIGGGPVFSPDGKRWAYESTSGMAGDPIYMVIDGVSTGEIGNLPGVPGGVAGVLSMYFSPNSKRFIYDVWPGSRYSGAHVIVSDRGISSVYEGIGKVIFSQDSKHFAYKAINETTSLWRVVLDGKEGKDYNEVGDPVFSPDSLHMAYIAKNDSGKFVVQDGNEGKNYSYIGTLTFSPDSKRLAYVAVDKDGGKRFVVVNGIEGKRYSVDIYCGPVFSPDSKHVIYITENCYECSNTELVIVDEVEEKVPYVVIPPLGGGSIVFDSNSTYHYLAYNNFNLAYNFIMGGTYLVEESLGEVLGGNTVATGQQGGARCHTDSVTGRITCVGLSNLGQDQTKDVNLLIKDLKNENSAIRADAAKTLGEVNDTKAVYPLIQLLKDNDNHVRKDATNALGKIGKPAVESLIQALKDNDSYVRSGAAVTLGDIRDTRAVEPLIQALKDNDSLVRGGAAIALGEINDTLAVEPLIQALKDDNSSVRMFAAFVLSERKDKRAIEPLIQAINDKNMQVSAAEALERLTGFGTYEQNVQDSVLEAIVRIIGIRTLEQLNSTFSDPRAVEPLIQALKGNDSDLRTYAAFSLGKSNYTRTLEPLNQALFNNSWVVRSAAVFFLAEIKDTRTIEPLIQALKDDNSFVRRIAAIALGKIHDTRAAEPLIPLLKDENGDVRSAAQEALTKLGYNPEKNLTGNIGTHVTFKPGSIWKVKEYGPMGNWDGEWVIRKDAKTIDASWSGGSITDIIDIKSIEGDQITLYRHGNNGYYTGTISPDGLSMSGTASWYSPGETWTASTT